MNSIEQVLGTTSATPSPVKAGSELGQEDFLKLLVAQLKNQDPSNPVENGEFLGQIAQFSMVSGIDDLGASFDGIAGSLYASQAMQASQLVGKEVLVETNTGIRTGEDSINGVISLAEQATDIQLTIHDASGVLVNNISLGSFTEGSHKFNWDGSSEDGSLSPAGQYVLSAEGLVNGKLQALPLKVYKHVESVSVDRANTTVQVHLEGDSTVNLSQVQEFK